MSQYPAGSSLDSGPSRLPDGGSSWRPLPYILSGFVTHAYRPSLTPPTSPLPGDSASQSPRPQYRSAWGDPISEKPEGGKTNPYEVPLDIGDEFFAFEEYRSPIKEVGRDVWFRGYVVQAVSLSTLAPSPSPTRSSTLEKCPRPEPSVLIGIFPASCLHVRPEASVDDGSLAAAYEVAMRRAEGLEKAKSGAQPVGWGEMEAVQEEEEEEEGYKVSSSQSNGNPIGSPEAPHVVDISSTAPVPSKRQSLTARKRPKSLVLDKTAPNGNDESEELKEQPPLPRLTAGDATVAGQQWPLVDEIACAIREWYGRLPTYLANREYRLFSTVIQHIDALFLGRRQLLSQTLSGDELIRVRRECVSRLVKGNVAQGLEVIVRSMEDGSVVVVEKERTYSGASWVSPIQCYVYQVQLAYIDLVPLDSLFGTSSFLLSPPSLTTTVPKVAPSSQNLHASSHLPALPSNPSEQASFHLLLDVRAFVANPCAPGETAELFFSLYNRAESLFITEEYCLILNHLGSPARDSEQRLGRLRTLFTDLKPEDLSTSVYLVCRLVRNGALKMRNEASAGTLDSASRAGSVAHRSGYLLSDIGTLRGAPSIVETTTDDSFSITSGFGGHRTQTIETSLTTSPSIIDGRPSFRRPLGCAVIQLPQLSKLTADSSDNLGSEISMPIFVPKDEATFANLHENVINNQTMDFFTSSRAEAIAISLKAYQGSKQQIVREHPSVLLDIQHSARLGFLDVADSTTIRNDLYIKLWSASFVQVPVSSGGSIRVRRSVAPSNHGDVQITAEVRRPNGTVINDAIVSGGSGESPVSHHHSLVFHHNDKPTYGELIKVSLPARSEDCHLFLTFRSRGKDRHLNSDPHELEKPFGFAYLPLIRDYSSIKDGSHDLVLYKMENNLNPAPHLYFDAPAVEAPNQTLPSSLAKSIVPLRDRLMVRTYLCSSFHTQDDTLRALFLWQTFLSNLDPLAATLKVFAFVNEEEIAKFVPRTLDALFGILVSSLGDRQGEFESLVFQAITKALAMTSDRRFANFAAVLNTYITTQFSYPASCFPLLHSMKATMLKPNTKEYRSFLKVWHLFFRFIIRSRELDRARGIGLDATSKHIEADFLRQTRGILIEINNLMANSDKSLIGTKTLAVQHYAGILPDLAQVFSPLEIAELVIAFADTLTFAAGSIALYKLLFLLEVVMKTFDTTEARALLVPAIVRWVKPHLGGYDQGRGSERDSQTEDKKIKWLQCLRIAVTVTAWTVNKLQEWLSSPSILEHQSLRRQEEDNIEYCLTLLPSLLESYRELSLPSTIDLVNRHQSTAPSLSQTSPDVFPKSQPFSLIASLPPPPQLSRQSHSDDIPESTGSFNVAAAECVVVTFALVLATPRANVLRWLQELLEIEDRKSSSEILQSTFKFCLSVIRCESFPAQWLNLNLMCFDAIIRLLDPVSELLETSFIPPVSDAQNFDVGLWGSLFELLCEFCGSSELVLEEQSQQRRRAQWIIAGDLRDDASGLLARLWNAIGWEGTGTSGSKYGGYQTRFTSLAGQILSLCLSSHDGTCEIAVEILFSMIYAEYVLSGQFLSIQSEIFMKLDDLFSRKTGTSPVSDPTSRAYFVAQLRAVFEVAPTTDPTFQQLVATFLDEVELFIDLLLTLRELPVDSAWKDERALALYGLISFTKRINRIDLYIRFVHQLLSVFLEVNDHLAAAHTLRLHADLYDWDLRGGLLEEFSAGQIRLPVQTQFARKEALYYHVIDHFAEAEAYESALELCQDLANQHQRMTFFIPKLSELLVHQARLWEKIGSTSRTKPEYFRVAYFGDVHPLDNGKDYVVRGQPWERYSDFCETIQHKHPGAMIHRSKIPPPESVRQGEEPVIWVTSLQAEPDLSLPVFADGVSENVQTYWRYNNIKRFSSYRPYLRDQSSDSVLSWTEKTILTTATSLPGVLCRSEVVDIRYEQISPISSALSEVRKATKALNTSATGPVDVKQLGNAINGAVDSPVNGGVKLYRTTFLDPVYLDKAPADSREVVELRSAILTYVKSISNALRVHREVCRDIAFHETLRSHFNRSFPDEIAQLPEARNSALDAPLPPLPNGDTLHVPTRSTSNAARASILSNGSAFAYAPPALRLGPSSPMSLSASPSIVTSSPPPDDHRRSTSVPATSVSSPRHSVTSGRGASRLSTNTSPGGKPSLGARTLSIVGSISGSGRSRDSVSVISEGTAEPTIEDGTFSEDMGNHNGGRLHKSDTISKKGLRRLSSLLRR